MSALSAKQAGNCLVPTKTQEGLYCFGQFALNPFGHPISPIVVQVGILTSFSLTFIFALVSVNKNEYEKLKNAINIMAKNLLFSFIFNSTFY